MLKNGELSEAQENRTQPPHGLVLVWVPSLCSQYSISMPDTLGNDLLKVAGISETACFIGILMLI